MVAGAMEVAATGSEVEAAFRGMMPSSPSSNAEATATARAMVGGAMEVVMVAGAMEVAATGSKVEAAFRRMMLSALVQSDKNSSALGLISSSASLISSSALAHTTSVLLLLASVLLASVLLAAVLLPLTIVFLGGPMCVRRAWRHRDTETPCGEMWALQNYQRNSSHFTTVAGQKCDRRE